MNLAAILSFLSIFIAATLANKDWADFKKKHKLTFRDGNREAKRLKNYLDNKIKRLKHNNDPKNTYKMAENKFSHLDFQELSDLYLHEMVPEEVPDELKMDPNNMRDDVDELQMDGLKRIKRQTTTVSRYPINSFTATTVPANINYTYLFNPPDTQNVCGSCWAFAAMGQLEGLLKHRRPSSYVSLSTEYLTVCGNQQGCNGGWPHQALSWLQITGRNVAPTSEAMPYNDGQTPCRRSGWQNVTLGITAVSMLTSMTENALRLRVANFGPQIVSLTVATDFFNYGSGIYSDTVANCFSGNCYKINHAVIIVGYGTSAEGDFWIVRNSWGKDWGEQGYIRIARNKGNMCNVNCYVTYATIRMT